MARSTEAQISLAAIDRNLSLLKDRISHTGAKAMPVVKADAYGHGAVPVSKCLENKGVDALCVACLEEAIELYDNEVYSDIIIFAPLNEEELDEIAIRGFIPVVSCMDDLLAIKSNKRANKGIKVVVEFDTGMGRTGFLPEQAKQVSDALSGLEHVKVKGLSSHPPVAESTDEDDCEYTRRQLQDFALTSKSMRSRLKSIEFESMANSACIFLYPESIFSAVRPGIALYGVSPSHDTTLPVELEPAMRLVTEIAQVRAMPKGACISYGRETVLKRESRVAILPIGYADGLSRSISPGFNLYARGMPAPLMGVVTMDLIMIDVTDVPGAAPGDRVLVMGSEGECRVSAEEHARAAGTIPYEVLTSIGRRVRRVYTD